MKVVELKKLEQEGGINEVICARVQKGCKRKWIWEKAISGRIQEKNEWSNNKEANRDKKASDQYQIVIWTCH